MLIGQPLKGHINFVFRLAFSPDGGTLATASADGSTRLWAMNVDQNIARICAVTRKTLTVSEWERHVGDGFPYDPPCE